MLSLSLQVSSQLAESSATEARLQEEVREGEENCQEMEKRLWEQQTTLKQQLAELARAAREKEQLETSLTAIREEVGGVWGTVTPLFPPSCVPWSTVAVTMWGD